MKLRFKDPVTGAETDAISERFDELTKSVIYQLKTGRFVTRPWVKKDYPENRDSFWHYARPYQKEGIQFLEKSNFRALLADDIGLGKTDQALLTIRYNLEHLTPAIIIVKSSLKFQWAKKIKELLATEYDKETGQSSNDGPMSFIVNDGKQAILPGFQFYILSMDCIKPHVKALLDLNPKLILIDESQNFKNQTSKRTVALFDLVQAADKIICLSGTPLMNRATEYFTTLNMLNPYEWPVRVHFARGWCKVERSDNGKGAPRYTGIKDNLKEAFLKKTSRYILRRKREDVLLNLPKFQRNMIILSLDDPVFKNAYKKGIMDLKALARQAGALGFGNYSEIMAILARLREITALAKCDDCIERVEDFLAENDENKILIGAHHKTVISTLQQRLKQYKPLILTGDNSPVEKNNAVMNFSKPEYRVMIASSLAAGEGIDGLQKCCSNMIVLERQWNVAKELQFEGRLNRSGQQNPVTCDYLVARNTIDEWMTNLIENKRSWVNSALEKSLEESGYEISIDDLVSLIIGDN